MIAVLPVRTPTVPPATHTNCYRVGGTVFDPASPYPDEQARLADWLGAGVERIVLTHHHGDHVGGVEDLRRRTGAPVWAHRDARVPFEVDHRIEDGEMLDTGDGAWRCLHTPGHADGHLCFLNEGTGDVIAGDMVAGVGTIVLVPPEGHLATYLDSLRRLRALSRVLHPAHGPALEDAPAALDHYTAHRHRRTEQVRAALDAGTPSAMARVIYADVPGVDFSLAAAQVRAHLGWLEERGEVVETDGHWRRS